MMKLLNIMNGKLLGEKTKFIVEKGKTYEFRIEAINIENTEITSSEFEYDFSFVNNNQQPSTSKVGANKFKITVSGTGEYKTHYSVKSARNSIEKNNIAISLSVDLISISFLDAGEKNGGDNEYPIFRNEKFQEDDKVGWNFGKEYFDPVWQKYDHIVIQNFPVCYKKTADKINRMKVDIGVKIEGVNKINYIITGRLYNHKDNLFESKVFQSDVNNPYQTKSLVSIQDLPKNIGKYIQSYEWQFVFPDYLDFHANPIKSSIFDSSHEIYIVYNNPIDSVEDQENKLTSNRLNIVLEKSGLSKVDNNIDNPINNIDIAKLLSKYVLKITKVLPGENHPEPNPRWKELVKPIEERFLFCDRKAALCASFLGIIGIRAYVHRTFATCNPVPKPYSNFKEYATNDYVSNYLPNGHPANPDLSNFGNRLKTKSYGILGKPAILRFKANNFEGCFRIKDKSIDGNHWFTVYPAYNFDTCKDLIDWYANTQNYSQGWYFLDDMFNPIDDLVVTLPINDLKINPDIILLEGDDNK